MKEHFQSKYTGSNPTAPTARITEFDAPFSGKIKYISVKTGVDLTAPPPPTGTASYDIFINGVSQFSSALIVIDDTNNFGEKTALDIDVVKDDIVSLHLIGKTQTGAVITPLTLQVTFDDGAASGLSVEEIQDMLAVFLEQGSNINLVYNDAGDKLTLSATDTTLTTEEVQDIVGQLIQSGSNITVNYDDAGNVLTINSIGGGGVTLPAGDLNALTNKLEKIQDRDIVIPPDDVNFTLSDKSLLWYKTANNRFETISLADLKTALEIPAGGASNGFSKFDPDAPYVSPSVYDDDFNEPALDSKWSFFNFGATNYNLTDIYSRYRQFALDYQWRGISQVLPSSGDWKFRTKISLQSSSQEQNAGLFLTNGTAIYAFAFRQTCAPANPNSNLHYESWSSATSFSGGGDVYSGINLFNTIYLQITKTGSNYYFDFSMNGLEFHRIHNPSISFTPTDICIGTRGDTVQPMLCDWFRKVDASGFTGRRDF